MKLFNTYLTETTRNDFLVVLQKLGYEAEHTTGNKFKIIVLKDDDRVVVLKKLVQQLSKRKFFNSVEYDPEGTGSRVGRVNADKFVIVAKTNTPNKGNIAEGVLGAALFAKFSKTRNKKEKIIEDITIDDVKKIVRSLKSKSFGDRSKRVEKASVVQDVDKNKDKVSLSITLGSISMGHFLDPTHDTLLANVYKAAVAFSNSRNVTRYARFLFINNKPNEIKVASIGVEDESSTKVDLNVFIDGRLTNLNISLKAGNATQFGQFSGNAFERQVELWKHFNVNIEPLEKKYKNKMLENTTDSIFKALQITYGQAAKDISKQLTTDKSEYEFLQLLAKTVDFFATRNDPTVRLVSFSEAGKIKVLSFKNTMDKLKDMKLDAKMELGPGGKPAVKIFDRKSKKVLLQIRSKIDSKSWRNTIEKTSLFDKLFTVGKG